MSLAKKIFMLSTFTHWPSGFSYKVSANFLKLLFFLKIPTAFWYSACSSSEQAKYEGVKEM